MSEVVYEARIQAHPPRLRVWSKRPDTIYYEYFEYDDGSHEHLLAIYGPSLYQEDADVVAASEDPEDIIRHLNDYPDNPEVEALITRLRAGA